MRSHIMLVIFVAGAIAIGRLPAAAQSPAAPTSAGAGSGTAPEASPRWTSQTSTAAPTAIATTRAAPASRYDAAETRLSN